MRHKTKRHILGVSAPHRSAMLGNLSVALIEHGRIKTTLAKAKALRPFIEKIITFAKKAEVANDPARKLHFRRLAISRVRDKDAVAKLFDERVSEFSQRSGGYTRIIKLGARIGDAAEMALIEFLDASDEGYTKPKKASGRKGAGKKAEPAEVDASATDNEAMDVKVEAATVDEQAAESPSDPETESEIPDSQKEALPAGETVEKSAEEVVADDEVKP
jgi:large subunit ribosomal protein L17